MPLRLEASLGISTPPAVASVSFARLVRAGVLPATSKASDPLSAAVKTAFAARYPGRPAPSTLGDVILALTGDADANGKMDVDIDALGALGLATVDAGSAAKLRAAQTATLTRDEFIALAGTHPTFGSLARTADLVAMQGSVLEVAKVSIDTQWGRLTLDERDGDATLTLEAPMAMSATGVARRAAQPGERAFTSVSLWMRDAKPELSFAGPSASAEVDVTPSGLLKEIDLGNGAPFTAEPEAAAWLVEAMLTGAQASTLHTPAMKLAADQLKATGSLRTQSTPPTDPSQRVIWAAARYDTQTRDAKIAALTQTWGVRPLRWTRWIDDASEVNTAKAVLEAAGGQTAIRPSYLFTIAMGEGMLLYLNPANDFLKVDTTQPVDGFGVLGVDTFASQVADLKRKGLVPAWFTEGRDYTVTRNVNEKGQTVQSADFPDLTKGLIALRAMLADCQARFRTDVTRLLGGRAATRLTQDQLDYFTYVYFNAGPGFGRDHLRARGLAAASKWTQPAPANNTIARYNAIQRLSTLKLVEDMRAFPTTSPLPAMRAPATTAVT